MIRQTVGFVGGGNMAHAIAGGLLRGGMHATNIYLSEPREAQRDVLRQELFGVQVTDDSQQLAARCEVLLFAVKPQILQSVCTQLADRVQATRPLIVSIAAGPRSADIDSWLGGELSVVRVMPNQPALIDQGISALFANPLASEQDRKLAESIMSAVGQVVWVAQESDIDSVTAVSGTGPAYFYLLIDIMIQAAIDFGLDPQTARALAVETARGATSLAAAETDAMSAMIDRVRSPGGTTTAAFDHLNDADVRGIFTGAIEAARRRAKELADAAN